MVEKIVIENWMETKSKWKGFAVDATQGDWSLFRNHIFAVIANGQQDKYEWTIIWMSQIFVRIQGARDLKSHYYSKKHLTKKHIKYIY